MRSRFQADFAPEGSPPYGSLVPVPMDLSRVQRRLQVIDCGYDAVPVFVVKPGSLVLAELVLP